MTNSPSTKTTVTVLAVSLLLVLGLAAVLGVESDSSQADERIVDWEYSTVSNYTSTSLVATQERVYFVGENRTGERTPPDVDLEDLEVSVYSLDLETGEEVWRFNIGAAQAIALNSQLTIHNGTVYASGINGRFYAIDADSGTEEWNVSTDDLDAPLSTVSDGVAYVGNRNRVRALDATTGRSLWSSGFNDTVSVYWVTASENTVYVGGETSEELSGLIIALNASSGERIWSYNAPDSVFFRPPSVGDDSVYIRGYSSIVRAIDIGTGEQEWEFNPGGDSSTLYGSVYLSNGTVYSPGDGVYAIDARTGEVRWRYNLSKVVDPRYLKNGGVYRQPKIETTPVVEDGNVYIGVNKDDVGPKPPHVFALDAESGELQWSVTSGKTMPGAHSPAVEGDRLYVGTEFNMNGTVYALNLTALRKSDRTSHTIDGGYRTEEGLFPDGLIP